MRIEYIQIPEEFFFGEVKRLHMEFWLLMDNSNTRCVKKSVKKGEDEAKRDEAANGVGGFLRVLALLLS